MATIEDAIELATQKFRSVLDKGGEPYILHLMRVMLRQTDEAGRQAGVLHDLIEDTDVTLEELRELNFSDDVIAAVEAMTHSEKESYADYVIRLSQNPTARKIKLADLDDNYRLERVAFRADCEFEDSQRMARYILSYRFLTNDLDQATYLLRMAKFEEKN